MIDLHPDYLMFHTSAGETIPCSAEAVAIELVGDSINQIDPEIIRNAALAVLYYFKSELGRSFVTVHEFTDELEKVLRGFGFGVKAAGPEPSPLRLAKYDLRALAHDAQAGLPLAFFPRLRAELRRTLREQPRVLQFDGLRGCVKLLIGARRWSDRCQRLSDEIVDFLRECLQSEHAAGDCALVVR
jgi:hypothetical protein